jgi:AraC family transcriptional regulator of arabinose operon
MLMPGTTEFFVFGQGQETTCHSWIAMPPDLLERDLLTALAVSPRCLPLSSAMTACVNAGIAIARVDDPQQPTVLSAIARAALLLYVSEARRAREEGVHEHVAVTLARSIARQHAREGLTVNDLAKTVGVSPEHLVRLFRRDLGTTPGALLRAERLTHAVQLLTHTGLSVAEVAHQAGYADAHHFARSLRRVTGLTATELRRRNWTGQDTTVALP